MNMLYGVHKPTSGKILLNGKELVMNSPTDAIRNGIVNGSSAFQTGTELECV